MGANQAGFDVIVVARRDGMLPGGIDTISVSGIEGVEPSEVLEILDCESQVVEESLIGISNVSGGVADPHALRVEIGEDTVSRFTGDQGFFVFLLARGNVDGEATKAGGNPIGHDSVAATFEPEDAAIGGTDLKLL